MVRNFNVSVSIIKLYAKLMIPTIVIIFLIIWGTIYKLDDSLLQKTKKKHTEEIIDFCSHEVEKSFNVFFDIARNYNILLNNYDIINNHSRRTFYKNLTEHFITNNDDIQNIWVAFEKNKFDDQDDQNGNFCLYLNKIFERHNRITKIQSNKDLAAEKQKYIELLKTDKLPQIILNDSLTDDIKFTFCFPVFDKNQNVIGATGIDIELEKILNNIDKFKIKLIKDFALVSAQKATYIYNQDKQELTGKSIKESPRINYHNYNYDSIIQQMSNNQAFHFEYIRDKADKKASSLHYIPLKIKETYTSNIYGVFLLDKKFDMFNTDSFINNLTFYFISGLVLSIIFCILLAVIINDISTNRIIVALDKLEGEK